MPPMRQPPKPPLIDLTRSADPPDAAALWDALTTIDPAQWQEVQAERLVAALEFLAARDGRPGLGQDEFAHLSGANERSVRRWVQAEMRIAGEALVILLALIRDPGLAAVLRDHYTPSGLPLSESMDRMLFVLRRDPGLLRDLLPLPPPEAQKPTRRRQRTTS